MCSYVNKRLEMLSQPSLKDTAGVVLLKYLFVYKARVSSPITRTVEVNSALFLNQSLQLSNKTVHLFYSSMPSPHLTCSVLEEIPHVIVCKCCCMQCSLKNNKFQDLHTNLRDGASRFILNWGICFKMPADCLRHIYHFDSVAKNGANFYYLLSARSFRFLGDVSEQDTIFQCGTLHSHFIVFILRVLTPGGQGIFRDAGGTTLGV